MSVGHPTAVTAIARALAAVTVVTGIRHHVHVDNEPHPLIRLDVTCYPPQRIPDGDR